LEPVWHAALANVEDHLEQQERNWIDKYRAAIQEPEPSRWQRTKQLSKSAAAHFVTAILKITGRITKRRLQADEPPSILKRQEPKSGHIDAA
jgi:hypothetical protein